MTLANWHRPGDEGWGGRRSASKSPPQSTETSHGKNTVATGEFYPGPQLLRLSVHRCQQPAHNLINYPRGRIFYLFLGQTWSRRPWALILSHYTYFHSCNRPPWFWKQRNSFSGILLDHIQLFHSFSVWNVHCLCAQHVGGRYASVYLLSPCIKGGIVTLHWLHLYVFSPLCVFKWTFKLHAWDNAKSRWLHS